MARVQADSFSFAGVDMLGTYGIRAVSHDVLLPRLRERRLVVPGRDGSWDFGARRYEDRVIRVECDTRRGLGRGEIRELAHLLSRKGRLVLWDEPEKEYVARVYEDVALEYLGRVGHAFTLVFLCEPFAIGETVTRDGLGRMQYEGTAETGTRLMVRNAGQGMVGGLRLVVRRRG